MGRVAIHHRLQSQNYFSFRSTWLFQMKLNGWLLFWPYWRSQRSCFTTRCRTSWLKKFCTFDKAFLCFWPFPWSVSADFPLDDNSITSWQTLHRALVFCLSFTNQSLNCVSSSQLSTNISGFLDYSFFST